MAALRRMFKQGGGQPAGSDSDEEDDDEEEDDDDDDVRSCSGTVLNPVNVGSAMLYLECNIDHPANCAYRGDHTRCTDHHHVLQWWTPWLGSHSPRK